MLSVDFDILTFGICFLLYVPVFLFLKFKCKKINITWEFRLLCLFIYARC